MLFLSRLKAPRYIIESEDRKIVTTNGRDEIFRVPAKRLLFKPLGVGSIKTSALPKRNGSSEAWGKLDTAVAKQRPGMTEEEADNALFSHPKYGKDFFALGDDGKPLVSDEMYIQPSGRGKYCALCDQQLENRGVPSHLRSQAHKANLAEKESETNREAAGATVV